MPQLLQKMIMSTCCVITIVGCGPSESKKQNLMPPTAEDLSYQGDDQLLPLSSASHCLETDSVQAINDGILPKASFDWSIPRLTWWDHVGTTEWVSYKYIRPRMFTSSGVYWFDDSGQGQCRPPAKYRLLWRDGNDYRPVVLKKEERYGLELDGMNEFAFEPITTDELRLEVTLQPEFSGGIMEWQVR